MNEKLTDEQLKGIAAQALNMALRDIEQGTFNFLLASYHSSDVPPLYRMSRIEALIIQRLGENWLNHGDTKDVGFHILRMAVNFSPPDAVVLVTVCNGFSPTLKFWGLSVEKRKELLDAGHDRHHQAVREGLLEVEDALISVAQSPERVCMYQQAMDARGKLRGSAVSRCSSQEGWGGRLKMFGEEEPMDASS